MASPTPPARPYELERALGRLAPAAQEAAHGFAQAREPQFVPEIVRGAIHRVLAPAVAANLPPNGLPGSARLTKDLGLDSLSLLELAFLLEEILGIQLSDEQVQQIHTVDDAIVCATAALRGEEAS